MSLSFYTIGLPLNDPSGQSITQIFFINLGWVSKGDEISMAEKFELKFRFD